MEGRVFTLFCITQRKQVHIPTVKTKQTDTQGPVTILLSVITDRAGIDMLPATLARRGCVCREAPPLTGPYRVISLADWSSGCISELSPLLRDSLRFAREVTTFATVPRAPWLVSAC